MSASGYPMRFILPILALWLASIPIGRDDSSALLPCLAWWERADIDGDGILDGHEATPYLAMMYLHKMTPPEDGRIDRSLFLAFCRAGTFRTGLTSD